MQQLATVGFAGRSSPKRPLAIRISPAIPVEAPWSTTSSTSERLFAQLVEIRRSETSRAGMDGWNQLVEGLEEIKRNCAVADWDGYGATALTDATIQAAAAFANALPRTAAVPAVMPAPDGGIGFEWRTGATKIFTITAHHDGRLVFAFLALGITQEHGEAYFRAEIPQRILDTLQRDFPAT